MPSVATASGELTSFMPGLQSRSVGIDQHARRRWRRPRESRRIVSWPSIDLPDGIARLHGSLRESPAACVSGCACTRTVTNMPRTSAGGPTGAGALPCPASSDLHVARIGHQHAAGHGPRPLVDADAVEPRQHALPRIAAPAQLVADGHRRRRNLIVARRAGGLFARTGAHACAHSQYRSSIRRLHFTSTAEVSSSLTSEVPFCT